MFFFCGVDLLLFFVFFRPRPTGHVLNMLHDNVKACEEAFGRLQDNHMMSPTLIQINRTSPWSPCSATILTDFLDSGHGEHAETAAPLRLLLLLLLLLLLNAMRRMCSVLCLSAEVSCAREGDCGP